MQLTLVLSFSGGFSKQGKHWKDFNKSYQEVMAAAQEKAVHGPHLMVTDKLTTWKNLRHCTLYADA